jgi:hypothetical protein
MNSWLSLACYVIQIVKCCGFFQTIILPINQAHIHIQFVKQLSHQ